MRFCPNCGKPASDEGRFCEACGRPFSVVVGASSASDLAYQSVLPFQDADKVAIRKFGRFGLLSLVAFVVTATYYLPLGISYLSAQLVSAVAAGIELVGIYYLRSGFKALSKVDQPRFRSTVTFTTLYAIGFIILIPAIEVFSIVLVYGPVSPRLPFSIDPSVFLAVLLLIAAFGIGGIVSLVGLIGGIIIGLWRVGGRYGRTSLKVTSILFIIPVVNIAIAIVLVVVFRALKTLADEAPIPTSPPPQPPSSIPHTLRNVLIVVAAVFLIIVVLGAALYPILSSLPGLQAGPHLLVHSSVAPTGITDYGLTSASGSVSSYKLTLEQVTAQVTVNEINATSAFAEPRSNLHVVSLQLNTWLRVNTTKGTQVFWLQNIAFLNTETGLAALESHVLSFNNEIFNSTTRTSALDNSTTLGTAGRVYRGPPSTYASNSPFGIYYSFPLVFSFYTNESVGQGGVTITMGYDITQGSTSGFTYKGLYDIIFLKIADVTGAAIIVDGHHLTPDGTYFDAELVFAGPPGGYSAHFASMNSTLDMAYKLTSGSVTRPHSVWEFGSDTGETADNLKTNLVNGELMVTIGKVDLFRNYQLS